MRRSAVRFTCLLALFSALPLAAQDASSASNDALAALQRLSQQQVPAGASDKDKKDWAKQSEWLASAYERATVVTARERGSGMATGRTAAPSAATPPAEQATATAREKGSGMATGKRQHGIVKVYASLRELQQDLETEARQFNTLSNASKARHDMAMSAIRNMK